MAHLIDDCPHALGNWSLHRAACELKLNILHDPCGIAPFLLPPPGLPRRYKCVLTIHDAISLVTPEVQPLATRLIFQTLIPASGKTADGIITVSQAAADDLIKYAKLPEGKIAVTPNGVDAAMPLSEAEVASVGKLILELLWLLLSTKKSAKLTG